MIQVDITIKLIAKPQNHFYLVVDGKEMVFDDLKAVVDFLTLYFNTVFEVNV